jgi:hypothetical protein
MVDKARLTSQHELAIWQPAWPTVRVQCQHICVPKKFTEPGGQGAWGQEEVNIPFKLMTSRILELCSQDEICVLEDARFVGCWERENV